MMNLIRVLIASIGLLAASLAVAQSSASPDNHVIRLRAEEVQLTPVERTDSPRKFLRVNFKPSWSIAGHTAAGDPIVLVDGKRYSVAAIDVVTDEERVARTCLDKNAPKTGATRGFDACNK